jgi:hypothetical protein
MPASASRWSGLGGVLRNVEWWQWISGCAVVTVAWLNLAEWSVVPYGDNAIIEVRSRDVLSAHPPLVNMLSTVAADASVRHPGPLLFDLLALPVRLVRHGRGLTVGVALLHGAMVWTAGRTARRFLGADGAAIVAAGSALLIWTLGREILTEPWQPHVTLTAFVVFLVAAWGLASGSDRCAPALIFSFSLVVQTHASYLVVAPAVLVTAIGLRAGATRRVPFQSRPIVLSIVLFVALWAQPLVQQVAGRGRGNLGAIARAAVDGGGRRVGLGTAVEAVSAVLAQPPFWLRGGAFPSSPAGRDIAGGRGAGALPHGFGTIASGACLVALLVGIALAAGTASRRRESTIVAAGLLSIVAIVSATAFVARLPVEATSGLMLHKVRWLWPLGAFIAIVALTALARRASSRTAVWPRRVVGVVAVFALAAGAVQGRAAGTAMSQYGALVRLASQTRDRLPDLSHIEPVVMSFEQSTVIEAFVQASLVAELVEQGVSVRFTHPLAVAQYGDHYQADGSEPITMRVTIGPERVPTGDAIVVSESIADFTARDRDVLLPAVGSAEPIVVRVSIQPSTAAGGT